MKYKIMILAIGLAMMLISACTSEINMSDEELKTKLIDANTNIDTYSTNINMDMDMTIEIEGEELLIKSYTTLKGDIDNINKKMFLEGKVETTAFDRSDTIDMTMYILENELYVKTQGQWVKMAEMQEDLWSEQNQLQQTIDLIESGKVQFLDEEKINGQNYYVVEIQPDLEKLTKELLNQNELTTDELLKNINFEDALKNYSLLVWINKETYLIEKNVNEARLVLSAQDFGEDEDGKIIMDYTTEMDMHSINEDVTITLPNDAKVAQTVPTSMY